MSVPLIDWLLPAQRYEWKPRKHDLEAVRASHLKVQTI
jgi:hypothetical protein